MSKRPPMIFKYVQQPRIVDAVIDRLAELAAGAPLLRGSMWNPNEFGVCYQLKYFCNGIGSYRLGIEVEALCGTLFRRMGLHYRDPLGDFDKHGNRWGGRRGARRRRLCYDLMVQLIASAGYRGKYQ